MPLVFIRSGLAEMLAIPLRLTAPLRLRVARFLYEIWGRSQIRGQVEPGVQFIGVVTVEGSRNVYVGRGTRLGRRTFLKTDGPGRIVIGRDVTINDGATIVAYQEVRICDNTMVGEYVTIRDQNHGARSGELIRRQNYEVASVSVGDGAWLGRGVCVLKGVSVGDGAVVAANAVVTGDVAPFSIVGGVPARPIGQRKP